MKNFLKLRLSVVKSGQVFIFYVLWSSKKLRRPWKTIINQGNTFEYPLFESENEPVIFPKV